MELANILLREGLITLEADETFTGAQELLNGTTSPAEISDHFSTEQKKWLAQAVLDKKHQKDIYQTLQVQGLSEKAISEELLQLQQDPYFQIAQQQHFLVKKRDWLLDTLDRFARLHTGYLQVKRISTPSFEQFIQDYYSRNLPIIFNNAIDHWSAIKHWSPQYFRDTIGHQKIEVQFNREQDPLFERNSIQHKTQMSMNDYVDLIEQNSYSNNFYMTANNAKASQSSLSELFKDIGDFHNYTDHSQVFEQCFRSGNCSVI